nr:Na-translocating system protein MpsB [Flavobacteriales bacterium]
SNKRETDAHFTKRSHGLFQGWLITQTLGFWSAFRLFLNLFKPSMSPATATSLRHMDKLSKLTIENTGPDQMEGNLQIGYTIPEMIQRVENLLKSIGLVENFAPIVYVVSHGSSSVNNPHYAAYDCGACSGRPGSVNARVICYMANHSKVREELRNRGINIPDSTQFVGALHDTTRDEVVFYDEDTLNPENAANHPRDVKAFELALDANAKERSRRLVSIDTHQNPAKIHEKIRIRSVSLFEPRPELNHATNALCMIGKRELSRGLFLDRRSFLNSYDYKIDPDGKYLLTILNAAAPVCGGINLEYYFSRVDNQKLGAGTKLPHNVMGLFGVANGIDGDLRPGLPSQMIEVHDPIRLLVIVEHFPEVVLKTIQTNPATYEWFANEWVHLVVVNPETNKLFLFGAGKFEPYQTVTNSLVNMSNLEPVFETHEENLPVYLISES